MGSNSILEELDTKITLVLEKYDALKKENTLLKETIQASSETETHLRQEILKLKEEDELKDLELEDIVSRISQRIRVNGESTNKLSIAS